MIADYFRISFASFRSRKLRTGLTLLGIFIGVALLVTLMGLGSGLQKFVSDQFEQMGSDKIMVMPGTNMMGGSMAGVELNEKDMDAVSRTFEVEKVSGAIVKISAVKFKDETEYTWTIGMPVDDDSRELWQSMSSAWKVEEGRDLRESDQGKVAVGIDIATDNKIFERGVKLGDKIEVEDEEFEIVAIMGRIGNPEDDSQIYFPLDAARELFDEPDKYDMIIVQAREGADIDVVAERLKKNLRKSRDVKEDEEDFMVQTTAQLLESFATVLTVIQAVLIGLATISLLVGGIGIANTMYTSILERTKEIGVMKAIGAKNSDIGVLFLIESGMIGLGAGIVGVVIGYLISKGIEAAIHFSGYTMISVYMSPQLLIGSLLFAFVFGVVSGLIPALQAAKLKPVEALRYE